MWGALGKIHTKMIDYISVTAGIKYKTRNVAQLDWDMRNSCTSCSQNSTLADASWVEYAMSTLIAGGRYESNAMFKPALKLTLLVICSCKCLVLMA